MVKFDSFIKQPADGEQNAIRAEEPKIAPVQPGVESNLQLQEEDPSPPAIISLHSDGLTRGCYVDLSNSTRPIIRLRWLEDPSDMKLDSRGEGESFFRLFCLLHGLISI